MFAAGAVVSLVTSEILVVRIERLAERAHLSDALLGAIAALAADSPEITSAVTAIAHGQRDVGAGVVLGSAVFNLSALFGLGAVVARRLPFGKRVVALGGTVTAVLTGLALLTVGPGVAPGVTLACAVAILAGYLLLLGAAPAVLRPFRNLKFCARMTRWLASAVAEEELAEEEEFQHAGAGATGESARIWPQAVSAAGALIVVVGASIAMERAVTSLGSRAGVPGVVVGALVLGAVTGIPNAVASLHLARKGNGTGALSTALNSNNFNVAIGLLVPAAVAGAGAGGRGLAVVAVWCLVLTVITLLVAHRRGGLGRGAGLVVLAAYGAFAAVVVASGAS